MSTKKKAPMPPKKSDLSPKAIHTALEAAAKQAGLERGTRIAVRMTDAEALMLRVISSTKGLTASDWIRQQVRETFAAMQVSS